MIEELSSFEKIESVLFKGRDEASLRLSKTDIAKKERWMLCVSKMLDDPSISDRDLTNFLMGGCGGVTEKVAQPTAYRDLAAIKLLVGNIQLASKNWYRYMIIEACKKGIKIAEEAKDPKGIAVNADKIGKYVRADKEDNEIDRSKWTPPVFEPSDDLTLIGDGFKAIPNLEEERKKFREIFKDDIEDVKVEDNHLTSEDE